MQNASERLTAVSKQENSHRHYTQGTNFHHHTSPPKLEEAVEEYTKSIDCMSNANAHFQRGCIYKENMGEWAKARDDFTSTIELAKKEGDGNSIKFGYSERALSYFHLEQYADSIGDWTILIEQYGSSAFMCRLQELHFFRGVAHLMKNKIDAAFEDVNSSINYALSEESLSIAPFKIRSLCNFRLGEKRRADIDLDFVEQLESLGNKGEDDWFSKYEHRIKLRRGEKFFYSHLFGNIVKGAK